MNKVIVVCEDSYDGIMCGVYHAWRIKNIQEKSGQMNVELVAGEHFNFEMFAEYQYIETDLHIAQKVVKSLKKEFRYDLTIRVYRAAMSYHLQKADIIFKFMIDAYRIGPQIDQCLSMPTVMALFELDRNVMYEQHHYFGFVRFKKLDNQLLFSTITPKNNILTLLAPHFSDRLSMENWVIYDKNRKLAVVHTANHKWSLVSNEEINEEYIQSNDHDEEIRLLWKQFFKTIAIKERINPKLQRNNMPLRFREYMPEVSDENR